MESERFFAMLEDAREFDRLEQEFAELLQQGKRDEALALARDVAQKIDIIADYYYENKRDYQQAETFYLLAHKLYEQFLPHDSAFATSLNDLASLYTTTGKYEEAEPLYLKALDIWGITVGKSHPYFAGTLNNLAELYLITGDYEDADLLFQRALTIRREVLSEQHPDVAQSLNNLGMLFYRLGKYTEAEPLLQRACEIRRTVLGEKDVAYATSLNNLGLLYETKSDFTRAADVTRRALALWRDTLGEKHPTYAIGLNNLGVLYQGMGEYAQAESYLQQALALRRELLPANHPFIAANLNNLARLYQEIGKYDEAEALYEQALALYSSSLKREHFEVAQCLDNLASLEVSRGAYQQAEKLYLQAVEMTRQTLGPHHPDVARCMNSLAVFYETIGQYEQAQALLREALEMMGDYGDEHPITILCLDNLATTYFTKGDYVRAERLYQQVLELRRDTVGEQHPDVAQSLNSLARLYTRMGDNVKAQQLYEQALTVVRHAFGETHRDVAEILNNLAFLYDGQGMFAQAEERFQQALAIWRTTLSEDHPDIANTLNNLGTSYYARGDYEQAEQFIEQALALRRKVFGESHLDVLGSLNNLAVLYDAQGKYAEAELLYLEVLAKRRQILGEFHPDIAQSLRNLAGLFAATARYSEALALFKQASDIDDQVLGQIFSIGSENQRLMYLTTLQEASDSLLSLLSQHLTHDPTAVQVGLELLIRRKGLSAEALLVQRETVWRGRYPALEPKLDELLLLRAQIAQKLLAGPAFEEPALYQQTLERWHTQQERLESELARDIPEMNLVKRLRGIDRLTIAQALPPDAILIEFAYFNPVNFGALPLKQMAQWQAPHYLAFILNPHDPDRIQVKDLGEASVVHTFIDALRTAIIRRMPMHESYITSTEKVNLSQNHAPEVEEKAEALKTRHILSFHTAALPEEKNECGYALRRTIFDPLLPALQRCKRLFIVPDAELARVPFEILPTDVGGYVLDDYQISYLSASRDLVRFTVMPTQSPDPALVIADPDFDLSTNMMPEPKMALDSYIIKTPGQRSFELMHDGLFFPPLPATREEGQKIAAVLQVAPLLQRHALDRTLKNAHSPSILHIATHGFFLPDLQRQPAEKLVARTMAGGQEENRSDRPEHLSQGYQENPLLRSGLALAGANTWRNGGTLPEEAEDGLLTAEDVTAMDLSATELVVLSACETALGQVSIGEGVFGLRRSFMIAGARTLVMSLWQVPDRQTLSLMLDFYQRMLKGQPRASALREAQLTLRKQGLHPYFWGAFICQGDPGPLLSAKEDQGLPGR